MKQTDSYIKKNNENKTIYQIKICLLSSFQNKYIVAVTYRSFNSRVT